MRICSTAKEWVEAAMVCGFEPYMSQQGPNSSMAGEWLLSRRVDDIDDELAPNPAMPHDEWMDEVFEILDRLGRCARAEESQS
jgi:hypothetical protein